MKTTDFLSSLMISYPETLVISNGVITGFRCISCGIFKDALFDDCSNNGISNRYSNVLVPCPSGPEYIEAKSNKDVLPENLCLLNKHQFQDSVTEYFVPNRSPEGLGWMHGGTFLFSTDFRFREYYGDRPIPLYDHQEFHVKNQESSYELQGYQEIC